MQSCHRGVCSLLRLGDEVRSVFDYVPGLSVLAALNPLESPNTPFSISLTIGIRQHPPMH
jgi:hypothetical protein